MKKLFFLAFITIAFTAAAQDDARARIGIKGGVNFSNISKDKDGNIDKSNMLPSFHVGLIADVPLGVPIISLQPGLLLSGKGAKYEIGDGTMKLKPFYLNLDVNLLLNIPFGDDFKVFAGVGPYGALGLFGKLKTEGTILGIDVNKDFDIKFSDNKDDIDRVEEYAHMKRFDVGANLTAGVVLSNIMLSANYQLGFTKMRQGVADDNDDKGKNRSLSISIGFLF
ncbi:MAG: PorT family protein [Bacteroidales bacterium]|jgi:hypothetical protein|nr:PorT family protein [Bacteroidales bacterium]